MSEAVPVGTGIAERVVTSTAKLYPVVYNSPFGVPFRVGGALNKLSLKALGGLLDAGDPEGKGRLAKMLQFFIKRGEGDIPAPFKKALDLYEKAVKLAPKILGFDLLIKALGAVYAAGKGLENRAEYLNKNLEKELEANLKKQISNEEILRTLLEGEGGPCGTVLMANQVAVLDSLMGEGWKDLEGSKELNLFRLLGIDSQSKPDAEGKEVEWNVTPEEFASKSELRLKVNNLYKKTNTADELKAILLQLLPVGTIENPDLKEIVGADEGKALTIKTFLVKELQFILNKLHQGEEWENVKGQFLESEKLLNFFLDENNRSLILKKGNGKSATVDNGILEAFQNKIKAYKEALLCGFTSSIAGTSDSNATSFAEGSLAKKGFSDAGFIFQAEAYNPFMLLGFVGVPNKGQLQKMQDRLQKVIPGNFDAAKFNEAIKLVGTLFADGSNKSEYFKILNTLSPKELETLNNLSVAANTLEGTDAPSKSITLPDGTNLEEITNTEVLKDLRALFSGSFESTQEQNDDFVSQILIILNKHRDNIPRGWKEFLEKSANLDSVNLTVLDRFLFKDSPNTPSALKVIGTYNKNVGLGRPKFLELAEGLGGDFSNLVLGETFKEPAYILNSVRAMFEIKLHACNQLISRTDSSGNVPADLYKAYLKHLEEIAGGKIIVQENLRRGRDHSGMLSILKTFLEAASELQIQLPNSKSLALPEFSFNEICTESKVAGLTDALKVLYEEAGKAESPNNTPQKAELLADIKAVLETLGAFKEITETKEEYKFNPKILVMYLNGFNIRLVGSSGENLQSISSDSANGLGVHFAQRV